MRIRYSQVVGDLFYRIALSEREGELCDIHFTAAAHHYQTLKVCDSGPNYHFHNERFLAHLLKMKAVVYSHGDFVKAIDDSKMGLDTRDGWHPRNITLPAPDMFDDMNPDADCPPGTPHVSDEFLDISVLNYVRKVTGETEIEAKSFRVARQGH